MSVGVGVGAVQIDVAVVIAAAGAVQIAVAVVIAAAGAVQIAVATNIRGHVHVAASGSDHADQTH